MGIFSTLFGRQEDEPESQPKEAPEVMVLPEYTDDELNDLCWACSGGSGDGMCGYHSEQCDREMKKRRPFSR